MKRPALTIVLIVFVVIAAGVGLSYGFGWIGVHQKKTIGKGMENARREVFEETQSFVEGKRQEALKWYKEYNAVETEDQKQTIRQMVSHSFANFDDNKLEEPLRSFVTQAKYSN